MMCSRSRASRSARRSPAVSRAEDRVHGVREVLGPVDEPLVLDADAALVVRPVARVERHVQLADRLRYMPVAAHDIVRRGAVPGVLEDLQRVRVASPA